MKRKIRIQRVSAWNIDVTIAVAIVFILICIRGEQEFRALRSTTEDYIACETAANQLKEASDYLTDQARSTTIFSDMYLKMKIGVALLVALMLLMCIVVRKLIVKPLLSYNQSILKGEIFPVIGAAELQNLAVTYNRVYEEKQETQRLIRHQAEHDVMTDLLNRGSFEKLLKIHESGDRPFALILIDVDTFKTVNDTYGHAIGDKILKKVSGLLQAAFRSIDFVCRIGGDEFAVIMVEMTSDLKYTIEDKIQAVNEQLADVLEDGLPKVSLSVGVAFSERENPGESLFKDADKALYYVKEHGRNGCGFYE